MLAPPVPEDEARRLERLRRLGLLDTGAEAVLDSFTDLAASVTGMPIALISLVDSDRQWFKSARGLPQGGQTPREVSFCGHAVAAGDELFEVEDATCDPRFQDNPIVTGALRVVHYAGVPLVMPGGERIGTLCVIDDHPGRLDPRTARILTQIARSVVSVLLLRESERNLEARLRAEEALRESQARYKAIADELAQSHRRKDEFLAMLAHELRNPLAPIATAAQLLRLATHDPARVLKSSELIGRQVAHMTELVDDLLDVSRVTRGLVHIEHESVDLQQVVHDALEQTRPQIEARGHAVDLRVEAAGVHVRGDRVRLVQVLANLLNNAAKYTPDGGYITVVLRADAHSAQLAVRDDGSGIDADLLPHVFELFTQARRTPDRAQGGLGVGLALVKSLVELHDGQVRATSAGRGQGSEFTVILPRQEPAAAGDAGEAGAPAAAPPRALRIMVVDDNADAAELLGAWLETLGHQVRVMTEPGAALEAARRDPAQVYVLDIGLPGMDGYELARHLRADPRTRRATLIALTGYGQAQDMLRSRESGFDHHFVKPADPQRLAAVMDALAANAESAQQSQAAWAAREASTQQQDPPGKAAERSV
ncbi:hybrid sensor histidine kinase/response regulator [Ramlibacter sp. MAHUQ-53]|uniref:hybrid sensor histidine kinase/response regulator n=1 Tax=unclassified Ramlibacter TaxID=2617605 RepID=UPI0036367EB5